MRIKKILSLLILLLFLIPLSLTAQDKTNKAEDVLKLLEKEQSLTKTLKVSFYQVRSSGLMMEDLFSEGVFYYLKPGLLRCEYFPPDESMYLITENTAYIYTPEINQVEKYELKSETEVKKLMSQILIGFGGSVEKLKEEYTITSHGVDWKNDFEPPSIYEAADQVEGDDTLGFDAQEEYAEATKNIKKLILDLKPDKENSEIALLKFSPKPQNTNPLFAEIQLWVDLKKAEPLKIFLKENQEDSTVVFVKTASKNEKLDEKLFKPIFPDDAEIIEPQKQ